MSCNQVDAITITANAKIKQPQVNGGFRYVDLFPECTSEIQTPSYSQGQLRLGPHSVDKSLGVVTACYLFSDSAFSVKMEGRDPITTKIFCYDGRDEEIKISNNGEETITVGHVVVLV